ncbi:hypothetical protein EYF80_002708 [Liparis tanakae]|uniref:Uncharacterized protein n=1 Tax=Liparis tanakae TaxID=230148 RepID=A0A4Z2JB16_9TELE|nr:hypothetical protein EYF80_002708 [Liparis tanakae]
MPPRLSSQLRIFAGISVIIPQRLEEIGIAPALRRISSWTGVHWTQLYVFNSVLDIWARQSLSWPSITKDTIGIPYSTVCPTWLGFRFLALGGLVWAFMKRRKDTSSHSEVRVSLCFASYTELTRSSSWRIGPDNSIKIPGSSCVNCVPPRPDVPCWLPESSWARAGGFNLQAALGQPKRSCLHSCGQKSEQLGLSCTEPDARACVNDSLSPRTSAGCRTARYSLQLLACSTSAAHWLLVQAAAQSATVSASMAPLAGAPTDIGSLHAATDTEETCNVIQELQFELHISKALTSTIHQTTVVTPEKKDLCDKH